MIIKYKEKHPLPPVCKECKELDCGDCDYCLERFEVLYLTEEEAIEFESMEE